MKQVQNKKFNRKYFWPIFVSGKMYISAKRHMFVEYKIFHVLFCHIRFIFRFSVIVETLTGIRAWIHGMSQRDAIMTW